MLVLRRGRGKAALLAVTLLLAGLAGHAAAWKSGKQAAASCSRSASREARVIVSRVLYATAAALQTSVPASCPLSRERDLFAAQERAKSMSRPRNWHCSACGKAFKTEAYLDRHLAARHDDLLPEEGACLAEQCELLRCAGGAARPGFVSGRCRPDKMAQLQQSCRHVMHACADTRSAAGKLLFHRLEEHYCDSLRCDAPPLPPLPRDGSDAPLLGGSSGSSNDGDASSMSTARWVLLVVVPTILLLTFYAGLAFYRSELSTKDEMTSRKIDFIGRLTTGRGRGRRKVD